MSDTVKPLLHQHLSALEDIEYLKRLMCKALKVPEWFIRGYRTPFEYFGVEANLSEEESAARFAQSCFGDASYQASLVEETLRNRRDSCFITTARVKGDLQRHEKITGQLDKDESRDCGDAAPAQDASAGVH